MSRLSSSLVLVALGLSAVLLSGTPAQAYADGSSVSGELLAIAVDTVETRQPPRTLPRRTQEERARGVNLDTVSAQRFDTGRFWTLDDLPAEYLEERYNVVFDEASIYKIQAGTLRIPGCSGSIVSPSGLLLTTHRCARPFLAQAGEQVLQDGFYASTLQQERPVDGFYAEQLIEVRDVTDEVESALDGADTPQEREVAYHRARSQIAERLAEEIGGADGNVSAEVRADSRTSSYTARIYQRFDDIRLVLAPEHQIAFFGRSDDELSYPRYTLDITLFRIYDDGEPLRTGHHLTVSMEGAHIGEAVFAAGHPQRSHRYETASQLEFRRDVRDRALRDLHAEQEQALESLTAQSADPQIELVMHDIRRAANLYEGRLEMLEGPIVLARKRDAEQTAVGANGGIRAVVDSLEAIQQQKRTAARAHRAFARPDDPMLGSSTFQRVLLTAQRNTSDEQSVRDEYIHTELARIKDQPIDLEERLLTARLRHIRLQLGAEDEVVQAVLQGRSAADVAADMVQNSALSSGDSTGALEQGALSSDDPAHALIEAIEDHFPQFASRSITWAARENVHQREFSRMRHAQSEDHLAVEADGTLRLTDGRVEGYPYNGTVAPAFTSFSGLFNQYHSFDGEPAWNLPDRWLDRHDAIRMQIPLNMVSSSDMGGGMAGAPLLNRDLEVVGMTFDTNVESRGATYIFDPSLMRTVSVDVRGIFEAMHSVYGAHRIVSELAEGLMLERDADADLPAPNQ